MQTHASIDMSTSAKAAHARARGQFVKTVADAEDTYRDALEALFAACSTHAKTLPNDVHHALGLVRRASTIRTAASAALVRLEQEGGP